MDLEKQRKFNAMSRQRFHKGGHIKRKNFDVGGAVAQGASLAGAGAALGSVIPGIGTAIGGVVGGIAGFISGLFSGGPQPPNIKDPVTGQQITDAQGNVVATQDQLQSFATSLQGVNGVQNQQAVLGQIQAVAQGQGPNPAQAQLAEATGKNVASQAALEAGQRGASSNVGLIAREAAQQGAATQQESVGQAATLEAQQRLNALNTAADITGQQVAETQNALTNANAAATTNQAQVLGAQGGYNATVAGGQQNINSIQSQNLQTALTGAGQLASAVGAGKVTTNTLNTNNNSPGNPNSPNFVGPPAPVQNKYQGGEVHKAIPGPHKSHVANYLVMAHGGKVPAMVSPGEVYLNPEKVERVLSGENPLKIGEKIDGKPKVKGDSRKNDTVPKTLDEGGVVISRTHTKSPEKAELFVRRAVHMRKSGGSK